MNDLPLGDAPTSYRLDIDGLRALAVLAVIAYHANADLLPAGYAGVDVFFVISGFLISGQIYKEVERGTFSFRSFYKRRIKRILPAFAAVCLAASGAALYLLNVNDLVYFAASLAACWAFSSNVFFALLSSGYFDQRLELFPLLHTWSLGVEEQFYFLFPILTVLGMRLGPRRLLVATVALTVAFVSLSQAHSTEARSFFLLQYRAHELLLGFIALLLTREFPIRMELAANVLFAVGLGSIIAAVSLLDVHSGFPGVKSMIPCGGAALVLYTGARASALRSLLTNSIAVFVGRISYSLYLWHWPIFAFLRYRGIELSTAVIVAALAAIFAMAYLSWRFIETPLRLDRRLDFRAAVIYLYGIPAAVFFAFSAYTYASGGIPQRALPQVRELMASYTRETDFSRACSTRANDDSEVMLPELLQRCSFGDLTQGSARILLFGDSHANHFRPFLGVLAMNAHLRAVYHVMGGCPPTKLHDMSTASAPAGPSACVRHNAALLELAGDFKFVVLGGLWAEIEDGFEDDLAAVVEKISRAGAIPVIFRDSPRFALDRSQCVLRKARGWIASGTNCNIPYADVRREQARADEAIDRVSAKYPALVVIDPKKVMCDPNECRSIVDNLAVYMDSNHINAKAAEALALRFIDSYGNPLNSAEPVARSRSR